MKKLIIILLLSGCVSQKPCKCECEFKQGGSVTNGNTYIK